MAEHRTVTLISTLVATNSTTASPIPASAPRRSGTLSKLRGDMEITALNGNIQIAIGVQTSDNADSWTDETSTLIVTWGAANGVAHSSAIVDFSSIAGAKQWVRLVYYVKLSTGSTLATAFVRGSVDLIPRT